MLARRQFLKQAGVAAAAQSGVRAAGENTIVVDPKPLFDISPHLYMQFMEPLGITDSSVEAAWDYDADDWVSYANDPDNAERKGNGAAEPLNIKLWQIGNETSYGNATFTKDESIANTVAFARAMKGRDRSIRLIGWGDRGRNTELWA